MYYAIYKGGIFESWSECQKYVIGCKGVIYKKFKNIKDAKYFIKNGHIEINNSSIDPYTLYVYTDGSCIHNGTKLAKAGIGVYFKKNDDRNVSKPISGKQTNNTAEVKAIIEVYNILSNEIKRGDDITICSDSTYAIQSCTKLHKNRKTSNFFILKLIQMVKIYILLVIRKQID